MKSGTPSPAHASTKRSNLKSETVFELDDGEDDEDDYNDDIKAAAPTPKRKPSVASATVSSRTPTPALALPPSGSSEGLAGVKIAFTGEMSQMPREEVEDLVQSMGAKVRKTSRIV